MQRTWGRSTQHVGEVARRPLGLDWKEGRQRVQDKVKKVAGHCRLVRSLDFIPVNGEAI